MAGMINPDPKKRARSAKHVELLLKKHFRFKTRTPKVPPSKSKIDRVNRLVNAASMKGIK
ncbi:hypothetical protein VIBNIMADA3021_220006 [Vibrio nigripulchritudo MADA3021]|nr:hypothetical protein VIBNIMADA3021_220006 [Vibrio nigripulchritudo MADA3021]